jgi:hypothetical protein
MIFSNFENIEKNVTGKGRYFAKGATARADY